MIATVAGVSISVGHACAIVHQNAFHADYAHMRKYAEYAHEMPNKAEQNLGLGN